MKTTNTTTNGNITTTKTVDGFLRITTATITNDATRDTFTIKKNGKAKAEYLIVREVLLLDNETCEFVFVKVGANSKVKNRGQKFNSIYEISTFIELRKVILDYAEEYSISFYAALDEVSEFSQILSSRLEVQEIAILLDMPMETVNKIIKVATNKLKTDKELKDMNDEFKLNNKSYIVLKGKSIEADGGYYLEGAIVA